MRDMVTGLHNVVHSGRVASPQGCYLHYQVPGFSGDARVYQQHPKLCVDVQMAGLGTFLEGDEGTEGACCVVYTWKLKILNILNIQVDNISSCTPWRSSKKLRYDFFGPH